MMKTILLALLLLESLCACSYINRDILVDKKDLTGDDYRLFQETPAWDLAKAVQDEDVSKIKEILSGNPNMINYQEPKYGSTLLMLTIRNQQMESFKTLLSCKADINIHDKYDGTSALIEACSYERYDTEYAKILLEYGANVNDVEIGKRRQDNRTRYTPLMAAAKTGKLDLVNMLIKNKADINYENEYGQSALIECTMLDNYNITLCLLQNGADYTKPILYRPDDSIPVEQQAAEDKSTPIYLVDILRETLLDLDTEEYQYKMEVVRFLKTKGIDYRKAPIPEFIKQRAQEMYPETWKQYLEIY